MYHTTVIIARSPRREQRLARVGQLAAVTSEWLRGPIRMYHVITNNLSRVGQLAAERRLGAPQLLDGRVDL